MTYEGGLIGLLRPFALLCGLVSLSMLAMHGLVVDRAQGARRARGARGALADAGRGRATPRSTRSPGFWLANIPGFRLDSIASRPHRRHSAREDRVDRRDVVRNGPLGTLGDRHGRGRDRRGARMRACSRAAGAVARDRRELGRRSCSPCCRSGSRCSRS
jgi:hypothetical protein